MTELRNDVAAVLHEAKLLIVLGRDVRNAEGAFRGAAGQDPSLWSYRIKVIDPHSRIDGLRASLVLVTPRACQHPNYKQALEMLERQVQITKGEIRYL